MSFLKDLPGSKKKQRRPSKDLESSSDRQLTYIDVQEAQVAFAKPNFRRGNSDFYQFIRDVSSTSYCPPVAAWTES